MTVEKISYTREQAAEATGLSIYKVKGAIRDGFLPATQHGKDWIVFHDDLVAWARSGKPA
nr:MAG TPA_asm: helix-turn-helix domain protein [Caudoviricetes sp.]